MCGLFEERGKEVKKKRLWKVARSLERIAIDAELVAESIQGNLPASFEVTVREAVRNLDEAAFRIHEMSSLKK